MKRPVGTLLRQLAAMLFLTAAPTAHAAAQVTASEAFESIRALVSEQGGRFDVATVIDTGSLVLLSQVRISAASSAGSWTVAPDWIRLSDNADGTVTVKLPSAIAIENTRRETFDGYGALLLSDFEGAVSKGESDITLDLAGSLMQVAVSGIDLQFVLDRHEQISFQEWRIKAVGELEAQGAPLSATVSARQLNTGVFAGDGSGFEEISLNNVVIDFWGKAKNVVDLFKDQFGQASLRAKIRFDSANILTGLDSDSGIDLAIRTGPVEIDYRSRPQNKSAALRVADSVLQTIIAGGVYDSVEFEALDTTLEVQDDVSRRTTTLSTKTDLSGFKINADMFALLGAEEKLLSEAGELPLGRLVVEGSVRMPSLQAHQILDGEEAVFESPALLSWRLDRGHLEFLGATMAARGGVDHLIGIGLQDGMRPVGSLYAEIGGLKKLAELLRSVGLLTRESHLLMRFVIGLGKRNGKDQLGYQITLAGEDGITVNGLSLK